MAARTRPAAGCRSADRAAARGRAFQHRGADRRRRRDRRAAAGDHAADDSWSAGLSGAVIDLRTRSRRYSAGRTLAPLRHRARAQRASYGCQRFRTPWWGCRKRSRCGCPARTASPERSAGRCDAKQRRQRKCDVHGQCVESRHSVARGGCGHSGGTRLAARDLSPRRAASAVAMVGLAAWTSRCRPG